MASNQRGFGASNEGEWTAEIRLAESASCHDSLRELTLPRFDHLLKVANDNLARPPPPSHDASVKTNKHVTPDPVHFVRSVSARPDRLLLTEYLLTNGLGGFSLGTALGVPTRRYHGLLIAATNPPVGRVMALHSILERLVVRGGSVRGRAGSGAKESASADEGESRVIDLSTFEFLGEGGSDGRILHPDGYTRLEKFEQEGQAGSRSVRWCLGFEDPLLGRMQVIKRLALVEGVNACTVEYAVRSMDRKSWPKGVTVELRLRPMTPLRDFHALRRRAECDRYQVEHGAVAGAGGVEGSAGSVSVEIDGLRMGIGVEGGAFTHEPQWWYGCFYRAEADRGQDCREDLFSAGEFVVELRPDRTGLAKAELRAQVGAARGGEADVGIADAGQGRAGLPTETDPNMIRLRAAAADFVVRRTAITRDATGAAVHGGTHASGSNTPGVSVIAGYPWFSDWGRDTFISLPGLMLRTGRFAEAQRTLETFAACRCDGLIPNVFNDQSGEPEYNTVDASLWFIHAACEYARLSGDDAVLRGEVGEACLEIVDHYRRGTAGGPKHSTQFNICMDPFDKLLIAGTDSTQLTWMDARRDGVTFTPRHGKPVEINALWYSALTLLSEHLKRIHPKDSGNLRDLAGVVGPSFARAFWNQAGGSGGCLFDCLTPEQIDGRPAWRAVDQIRPNQLFGVSLPRSALSRAQQRAVVATVRDRLLTPMGVRTLDPADPAYRGRYEGRLFDRDAAYHQGTAWPWLLGVYAMAVLRAGLFDEPSRVAAARALAPILAEMDAGEGSERGGCLGQIAEVFDGSSPQRAGGCPAQAWSVAVTFEAMSMIRDKGA